MQDAASLDLAGSRLGRYSIVGLIGAGGMGRVYLARDEQLQRHVAIKIVHTDQPVALQSARLLGEARLLSRVSHRNVAAVYDLIADAGRTCIVMEFVPGATLTDVLAGGPLPCRDVLRLGLQLARGLAAAHAAGVVHRDLKPQNIKITPRGRLKILDFGVADLIPAPRFVDSGGPTPSGCHVLGTVPYMSPEQLRGDAVDERSDVFSAGAVLYEMASGQRAFGMRDFAHLVDAIQYDQPPRLTSINPLVPRALERIVSKAMEKDPEHRQHGATTLAKEIRLLDTTRTPRGAETRAIPSYS